MISKPSKASIKAKADKAELRSTGVEPEHVPTGSPLDPVETAKPKRKPKKPTGRAIGRRSTYTEAIGRAICKLLSNGWTLAQVCRQPGMPKRPTVIGWAIDAKHPFADIYARARRVAYEGMADEIIDIADNGVNDWMNREFGDSVDRVIDHDAVQRSKLRVDTRKWLLAKALPKVYGDKLDVKHDATEAFTALWQMCSQGKAPEATA